jgi:hypothetical protein
MSAVVSLASDPNCGKAAAIAASNAATAASVGPEFGGNISGTGAGAAVTGAVGIDCFRWGKGEQLKHLANQPGAL